MNSAAPEGRTAVVGLAVCVIALLACAGGGDVYSRRTAPGWYRIGCEDGIGYCYDEAERLCPYGYHVAGESQQTTGARAQTTMIGSNAITTVRTNSTGSLNVQCMAPVFCTKQEDCYPLGARCHKSQRMPGKNYCK